MSRQLELSKEQAEIKEQGFEKRYGKKVKISGEITINDKKELEAYNLCFQTPQNTYSLKEQLKEGLTEFVLFQYKKDDRDFNHRYSRFLDAEVSLADKISEE